MLQKRCLGIIIGKYRFDKMLRTIKVYGALAKALGQKVFRAQVDSVAEAIRFLVANFPGIENEIVKYNYRVTAGSRYVTDGPGVQSTFMTPYDIITITPIVTGASFFKKFLDSTVGKIITGALLVGLSFVVPFGGAVLFSIGASLTLSGVAGLLAPRPNSDLTDQNPRAGESYSFSGVQNTTRQGVPVPIVYGEVVTGSVVISLGYDTTDTSDTVKGTEEEQGDT
jgi:predicted phage tail protein